MGVAWGGGGKKEDERGALLLKPGQAEEAGDARILPVGKKKGCRDDSVRRGGGEGKKGKRGGGLSL